MHLIHVIAGTQGEQCFFLVSVFLLILNGSNPLIQAAIAHKMFLPFADDSFQRSADQFFFQQEPGQKRNVLLQDCFLKRNTGGGDHRRIVFRSEKISHLFCVFFFHDARYPKTLGFVYADANGELITYKVNTEATNVFTQPYNKHGIVIQGETEQDEWLVYCAAYEGDDTYLYGLCDKGTTVTTGTLSKEEFPGYKAIYDHLKADFDAKTARYEEALAIYNTLNDEYATYKGKYKTYLAEKLEYESEEDYGNGKMLFGDVNTVYDLGDAARLYNWDAGLVMVPR